MNMCFGTSVTFRTVFYSCISWKFILYFKRSVHRKTWYGYLLFQLLMYVILLIENISKRKSNFVTNVKIIYPPALVALYEISIRNVLNYVSY